MTIEELTIKGDLMASLHRECERRRTWFDVQFRSDVPNEWARAAIGRPWAASGDIHGLVEDGTRSHWRITVGGFIGPGGQQESKSFYGETFDDAAKPAVRALRRS
jgi:hypothetical protein